MRYSYRVINALCYCFMSMTLAAELKVSLEAGKYTQKQKYLKF